MKKIELLAPAGDLERLKVALLYGADAVYVGGNLFSLRANTQNFSMDELLEGVIFAHDLGKKVYVAVNIVMHNKELKYIIDYLKKLDSIGVDAVIVSDPAIVDMTIKYTSLEVHLSTQASTTNRESALFWKKRGVSRIVLARETSKEDIEDIRSVDIELECFIHGAMCSSYSGRCVLSNYFTNRDANRGGCSQICRWDFNLFDGNMNELKGDKDFSFCTKDLSMLKYLPDMIELGVASLKIEGRMRSLYYVATVVDIYRRAIDEYYSGNYKYNLEYERVLSRCANRDSIPQFFNGKYDYTCSYYNGRQEISNQDFLGIVVDYCDNCMVLCQRNYFKVGDLVEVFGPGRDSVSFRICEMYDEEGNVIDIARHPNQIIKIPIDFKVNKWDLIRKKVVDKNIKV